MGFIDAICSVYKNYCNFKGRATRSEYWYFGLFYFLVILILLVGIILPMVQSGDGIGILPILFGILYFVFLLGSIVLAWAVFVRRLHDTGRSGWWMLLSFVPSSLSSVVNLLPVESYMALYLVLALVGLACGVTMIVFLVQPSAPANEYGPNPFEEENASIE